LKEIVTYKGKLCEKESDFIWGDYIEEDVVKGLYHFWHHQNILARHEGMVYEGGDKYVDKEYKDSLDLHVPVSLHLPEIHNYLMSLQGVLNKYLERFPFAELSRFEIVEPLSLQHYPIGGGFKEWHTERANSSPGNVYRHLVFMTYLNDVPDGGTEWFHQDKYVPAKRGYTVIWPSDWTHFHRGVVSNTSEKFIITGWFSFT
jgi:hypothetical protein|tara:strand:- start:5569 stop:6174 length:606 start_codon:yes stop_codon:yes gene_type:complete